MNSAWVGRPFDRIAGEYETRIERLEKIVHLLLDQTKRPWSFSSSTPRACSFRYSVERGLIPVLSKTTAELLAITQSNYRACSSHPPSNPSEVNLKKPSNITRRSSHATTTAALTTDRQIGRATCRPSPHSTRLSSLVLLPTTSAEISSPPSAKISTPSGDHSASSNLPIKTSHGERTKRSPVRSLSLDRLPPYGLTAPDPTKNPNATRFFFNNQPSTTPSSSPSPPAVTSSSIDTAHLPGITTVVEPNDLSLTSSAASASLSTTAATTTSSPNTVNSLGITETTAVIAHSAETTKPAANEIDPTDLPLPSSNPASQPPSPRPSPPLIDSQPDPASDSLVVDLHPDLLSNLRPLFISSQPDLLSTTQADSRPDRSSVLPPQSLPLSTKTAVNTLPLSAAAKDHASLTIPTVHQPSNAIVIESCDPLSISSTATSPPLASTLPTDPTATTPSLTTTPVSTLQPEPDKPNCSSDSFDIAAIGSITVMEDSTAFKDPQLWAPSLSQAALENYKEIDDYLKTLKADETEIKKKKKKKKKKKTPDPNSIPDNPVLFYV
ncbi:hypothetical protein PGT21_002467 [Puccinia graminis f. sp. tritici]|uniref:Uncharacterized protein n=1 Tax=Puccinia graminis f. sp. tritici TaxID=56615 RepID=A0A5B0SB62_PUCGR|nr:hypothetical protein PGT21_002467 [Puccinia graminis f. sp. tritici]KAA1133694.1 hypothetical protein PGTUg99_031547 [Puccinia graminis f. sp. tritici]